MTTLLAIVACAVGGLALAFSQPPSRRYWLQLLAFAPFLWALNTTTSPLMVAILGAVFGLSYAIPLLFALRLPWPITLILLGSQSLTWIVFAVFALALSGLSPLPQALGLGAAATFLVWLEATILPLWGSAQCFAHTWSQAPRAAQFCCITGIAGAVWALVTLQALIVHALFAPASAPLLLGAAVVVVAVLAGVNQLLWRQNTGPKLKVATLGWAGAEAGFDVGDVNGDYARAVESAARQGARLVVSPEAAFAVADRDLFRPKLKAIAARHNVYLAVGYFDQKRNCNAIDFVAPDSGVVGRYLKTHLVPVYETYFKGSGKRTCIAVDGVRAGGMICQDDNFSDIARGYGRDGARVLAVPTNDWDRVAAFHWSNSRWRALENRYAIVRAASGGISGIASPRGEVTEQSDHFCDGFKMLLCEVPLGRGRATIYARWGDWFPLACGVLALAATLLAA